MTQRLWWCWCCSCSVPPLRFPLPLASPPSCTTSAFSHVSTRVVFWIAIRIHGFSASPYYSWFHWFVVVRFQIQFWSISSVSVCCYRFLAGTNLASKSANQHTRLLFSACHQHQWFHLELQLLNCINHPTLSLCPPTPCSRQLVGQQLPEAGAVAGVQRGSGSGVALRLRHPLQRILPALPPPPRRTNLIFAFSHFRIFACWTFWWMWILRDLFGCLFGICVTLCIYKKD